MEYIILYPIFLLSFARGTQSIRLQKNDIPYVDTVNDITSQIDILQLPSGFLT